MDSEPTELDRTESATNECKPTLGVGMVGYAFMGAAHSPRTRCTPDPNHRAEVARHFYRVIQAAPRLGVPVVNTFVGRDQHKTLAENLDDAPRKGLTELVGMARDNGVKLAIENCPMILRSDQWPGGLATIMEESGRHADDTPCSRRIAP